MFNFKPRPLYPQGNSLQDLFSRRLGGTQTRNGRFREEKNISPHPGIKHVIVHPVASSPYATPGRYICYQMFYVLDYSHFNVVRRRRLLIFNSLLENDAQEPGAFIFQTCRRWKHACPRNANTFLPNYTVSGPQHTIILTLTSVRNSYLIAHVRQSYLTESTRYRLLHHAKTHRSASSTCMNGRADYQQISTEAYGKGFPVTCNAGTQWESRYSSCDS